VEDRRNALIVEPDEKFVQKVLAETQMPPEGENIHNALMASLQAALKRGIEIRYQLESNELAAEPLPEKDNRRMLLFYEASEGGAGALRRLLEDPSELSAIAGEALKLCHFDTCEDKKEISAEGADICEAACYDCLLNYGNQPDHDILDRKLIRGFLTELSECVVESSSSAKPRKSHFDELLSLCGSELEKTWLTFMEKNALRLPTHGQYTIRECKTRADFYYADDQTVIYVDGPPHDNPHVGNQDQDKTECLLNKGYWVIRFHHHKDWSEIIDNHPSIFGKIK
jgi:very-short-patch-repair endonuclease